MTSLRRRNVLIGVGTLVFGASGFIASGAFEIGSEGSVGADWVRVAGTDRPVFSTQTDAENGPADESTQGGGGSSDDSEADPADEPTDDLGDEQATDEEPEEPDDEDDDQESEDGQSDPATGPAPVETRVQVVADPTTDGTFVPALDWAGTTTGSTLIAADEDGFFAGFTVANANENAISRIGVPARGGPTGGRPAFLVANVGDPETPGTGGTTVTVGATVADSEGERLDPTGQLRLPSRIVDGGPSTGTTGGDLLTTPIDLPVGAIAEVVIELDTRQGTTALEALDSLAFSATPNS